LRRAAVALALLGACACASRKTCKTDADCGTSAVCVEIGEAPKDRVRLCRATCATDADCLFTGKDCRALEDRASGPAAVETRDRYQAPNVNRTTRGAIRICRGAKEVVH
jgi:hypothetical protein